MSEALTPGTIARRDGFGGQEIESSNEIQASALAAQAEAEVKARWAIAQRCPRNLDTVRVRLLAECQRPGFAEVAKYAKPVGDSKVVGPSIRFVETALLCMGNVICPTTIISEDRETRRLQVSVTDLERNVSWPRQITIQKTVERHSSSGRVVVGERWNKEGKRVFIVLATEDELANKEAAAVSKAIRTSGLRLIPGDLVDEAMRKVDSVRLAKTKADPAGERKRLVDGFLLIGVTPVQLVEYLGHPLDFVADSEIEELRDLYAAIRDGETRWAAVMELRRELNSTKPTAPAATPEEQMSAPVATSQEPAPTMTPPTQAVDGAPTESSILGAIAAAESGKDLAGSVTKLMMKASPELRAKVMAAYTAKAEALKGSK